MGIGWQAANPKYFPYVLLHFYRRVYNSPPYLHDVHVLWLAIEMGLIHFDGGPFFCDKIQIR